MFCSQQGWIESKPENRDRNFVVGFFKGIDPTGFIGSTIDSGTGHTPSGAETGDELVGTAVSFIISTNWLKLGKAAKLAKLKVIKIKEIQKLKSRLDKLKFRLKKRPKTKTKSSKSSDDITPNESTMKLVMEVIVKFF